MDDLGDHLMTCKLGAELIQRHNTLTQAWERLIKKTSNTSLSLEKTLGSLGPVAPRHAGKRVDIMEVSHSEKTKLLDVTIVHSTPGCETSIRKYAAQRGAPALQKEKDKNAKYGAAVAQLQMEFLPLVLESYGRLGEKAYEYAKNKILQCVARLTNGGQDLGLQNRLFYTWWATLSCALQKGNSNIINFRFFHNATDKHSDKHDSRFTVKSILSC
jgi:hypothetical protein